MENPSDRVTYGDLRMIRAEFDELMQLSVEAGTLPQAVPYSRYADESFVAAATPATIGVPRVGDAHRQQDGQHREQRNDAFDHVTTIDAGVAATANDSSV